MLSEKTKTTAVALGLGSNLGDRLDSLRSAIMAISHYVEVKAVSSIYETPAAYVTDQPAFLNAALLGTTILTPQDLLHEIKAIESNLGRRKAVRYGPRVIDIDILFYGEVVMSEPELSLPHQLMTERAFVLRPLADIAPDWVHPLTHLTTAQMLERLMPQHLQLFKERL